MEALPRLYLFYNYYTCSGGFKGGIRTQVGRKAGAGGRQRVALRRCLREQLPGLPPAGQPPAVHPAGQRLCQPGRMDGISPPLQSWPNNVVWLQNQLAASKASWKLIVAHHPPRSSGEGAAGQPCVRACLPACLLALLSGPCCPPGVRASPARIPTLPGPGQPAH